MSEPIFALTSSRERPAATASGYMMLAVLLVAIVLQMYGIGLLVRDQFGPLTLALMIVSPIVIHGCCTSQPYQSRVKVAAGGFDAGRAWSAR